MWPGEDPFFPVYYKHEYIGIENFRLFIYYSIHNRVLCRIKKPPDQLLNYDEIRIVVDLI